MRMSGMRAIVSDILAPIFKNAWTKILAAYKLNRNRMNAYIENKQRDRKKEQGEKNRKK
jgi:hypothetical protein